MRSWREWAGLSRQDLASALEITVSAICYWETGGTTPSNENLERFVRAVGIDMSRFYGSIPKRPKRPSSIGTR